MDYQMNKWLFIKGQLGCKESYRQNDVGFKYHLSNTEKHVG